MRMQNDILIPELARLLAEEKEVRFTPSGVSMRPFIEGDKDSVILASLTRSPLCGDIVLAHAIMPDGKTAYVLHRIIKTEGNMITLQGDGNIRGVEHCTTADIRGVVIEYIRPNRTLSADDEALKRRIRLWRALRPIRRYLLFIYKAVL